MKRPTDKQMKEAVRTLLAGIGEDPDREGLRDTPKRVVKALGELCGGYALKPERFIETAFDAEGYDQMIVLAGIPFQSMCEHHILPFLGRADVGYIPGSDGRILGISKLARVVEMYARRLQNQERISKQVAETITEFANPRGVAVVLRAEHACVACRGIKKPGSVMGTSVMEGAFRYNEAARMEFFKLCEEQKR